MRRTEGNIGRAQIARESRPRPLAGILHWSLQQSKRPLWELVRTPSAKIDARFAARGELGLPDSRLPARALLPLRYAHS